MIQHRDKAPMNALIAQAVRSCAGRGIPHVWYAKFSCGEKRRSSVAEFKEHNGFRRTELPRYYVPRTFAGRTALCLGLDHRLADHVPEPVLAQARKLRGIWQGCRFQVPKSTL